MKNIFISKSGGLNRNWSRMLKNNPEYLKQLDELVPENGYDLQTRMWLMIRGFDTMPACKTCRVELSGFAVLRDNREYCSAKCSANDSDVKNRKLAATDTVARGKKISSILKGRNDYHAISWDTRRKKYGDSGFSESGLTLHKNESSKRMKSKVPEWMYDKNTFVEKYNAIGFWGIVNETNCGLNFIYKKTIEYGIREKRETVAEQEIQQFISSIYGDDYVTGNRKVISPYELDLYIPDKNLAIEYNGLFWHSTNKTEELLEFSKQHLRKTEMCEDIGIHLLHIFEDEWNDPVKREIWKSVIRQKLGLSNKIYARKCEIRPVDSMTANQFCFENHLQGKSNHSYAEGLYYNDSLVMLTTWGKPRYSKGYGVELELLRMCCVKDFTVVGGASKLTKGKSFVSYANRRWSFGNVYNKLGMEKLGVSKPGYFYFLNRTGKLYHRSSFMKHMLKDKFGDNYNESLSESENCFNNGYRKIWDCGNIVYIKR